MSEIAIGNESSEFKKGLQAGISIGIGYFPIALTFGLLAKTSGLSIYEAVLMSMVVFAGAAAAFAAAYLGANVIIVVLGSITSLLYILIFFKSVWNRLFLVLNMNFITKLRRERLDKKEDKTLHG